MMNWMSKVIRGTLRNSVGIGLLLLASIAPVQGPAEEPASVVVSGALTADEILQRALDRIDENANRGVSLMFESMVVSTMEVLDPEGRVTKAETKRSRRYPLEGYSYEELVSVDGEPLSPDQARKERRKREAFVRKARRQAARGERLESDRRRVRFNNELMDRYRTTVIRSEDISGHDCWVLRFEPRDVDLPSDGGMDRALNQSSGFLWIRKSSFHVARISFAMDSPVRYLWGVLVTLRRADGQIDFAPVQGDIWLPRRFQIEVDLQLLMGVKAMRSRIRNEWTDFRPVEGSVAPREFSR